MTDRSQEQSIHDPEKLRVMFIGEGLVLSAAIALVKKRGHDILGVFCASALEYETMKRNHLPVSPPGSSVKAFFSQRPFDVLFSINNGRILKASTIDLAQLAAVNYHNGPLPAYAGRWVTAWAILNGEATHGVTWHLIESGIDTGPILVQRRFELAQGETTGSLNLRCTQAAIEGFSEVLDKLERRDIRPVVQDPARRSYFRKTDTAPNGGLVDWTRSADDIVRLVRACDWGSSENRFGEARVDLAETGVRLVRSAEKASGSGPAGTVLAAAGSEVTVACADGAVRFRLADAKAMDADLPLPSAVGAAPPDDRPASAANSVIDLILAQASARPDAMAIGGACREVSRKDLVDRSLAVGARLLAEGVQLDDGVGILLPIGPDFVASALGAMMSGGAYVPLSAKSPEARLAREVAEAGVRHVVTTRSLADRLPASVGVKILFLDELPNEQADLSPRMPGPDQCAYRIFTSGSTGGIKSVEIGHSSLLNLCLHYKTAIPMGEDARMTALSSVTFDASVADIWPVLACGGALLIPPENLLIDVRHLSKWIHAGRATCAFVPTAIGERLLGLTWPDGVALRTLLIGGDTLHHRPPPGLPFRVVNTYGPTENTVDSLWAEIGPVGGRPLIGKPITGVTATVVDENHEPVDVGALGELALGGGQVAKGYRNRPELTAERFMTTKAGRVYYSGDRVRVNPDGDFEFHGRIDDQVQLLGVRVEPGEVEALLKADARVRDAACLPLRSGDEAIGLIAHVSTEDDVAEPEQLAAELRRLLSAQLPAAIVPKAIEIHRSLPYTAAGKLDRRQLERGRAAADDPAPAMAEDDLRSIWLRSVRGAVAGDDRQSFWDLGGDSLGAIGLLLGIETAFGVQIPVGAFLEDPSLSGLRHMIARGRSPTIIRLVKGAGPPLVLWYSASGDLESYQRLLPLLKGREVIGVLSPALADPAYAPESIEAAVTGGLDALREFGVDEVSAHIGFSWAGLLAFEAARQAEPRGAPSPLVVMIGTLPPLAKYSFWTHKTNDVKWVIERFAKLVLSPSYRRTVKLENIDRAHVWRHEKDINGRHYALGRAYRPGAKAKVSILYMREKFGHVYMRERPLFGRRDRGWSEWVSLDPEAHVLDVDHIGLINGDALGQIETLIRDRLADRFPVGTDAA